MTGIIATGVQCLPAFKNQSSTRLETWPMLGQHVLLLLLRIKVHALMANPKTVLAIVIWLGILSGHMGFGQSPSSRLSNSAGYAPDGVLEPWRISDVACVETGIIQQIYAQLGQRVQAGDRLARLKSTTVKTQLTIAQAQAQALGREQSVRADVELNQRKLDAIQRARQKDFSSQLELERAETELRVSQGRLLAELEDRRVLELQVKRLRKQLKQHTVYAPIEGIVVEIHKEVGEFVAPNSPEVIRIVDASRLRARFFLHEGEVQRIEGKSQAAVQLANGQTLTADIEHIAPVADTESGLIEVRLLIDNYDHKIRSSRCTLLLDGTKA